MRAARRAPEPAEMALPCLLGASFGGLENGINFFWDDLAGPCLTLPWFFNHL